MILDPLRSLAVMEKHQIDVGIGIQLAPAVPADGHQRQLLAGLLRIGKILHDALEKLVDQDIGHGGDRFHHPFAACAGAMPSSYLLPVMVEKMLAGGEIERPFFLKEARPESPTSWVSSGKYLSMSKLHKPSKDFSLQ